MAAVGSTPRSQQLDAEEWRDLLAQYQQAAAGAVARFGGHVAKDLGDGLLIYFGWPTAREDDPERAVRAGLAIIEQVSGVGSQKVEYAFKHPLPQEVAYRSSSARGGRRCTRWWRVPPRHRTPTSSCRRSRRRRENQRRADRTTHAG